jgi:hypothetical protein
VQTLRAIRRHKTEFDPRFFERSPHFAPIARAARLFAERADWPDPHELTRAFEGEPPVRFVSAPPAPRRTRSKERARARDALYDAVIVRERAVPTRPRMWHDLLNALVWATFPRAKLALHERQHRAIEAWIPPGATRLPNARTRELDMLALIDEGGVLSLEAPSGASATIVFGHALYEGLVLDNRAMIARSVVLAVAALPDGVEPRVALADTELAAALSTPGRLTDPDDLPRARL